MASHRTYTIHVILSKGGFEAFIAPLDGGIQQLSHSFCPNTARELAEKELDRLDAKRSMKELCSRRSYGTDK